MDRCERVLVTMARLNIDDRLAVINARATEAQVEIVTGVLRGAIADIGLSQEMQDAVRPAIARRLRLVRPRSSRASSGPPHGYRRLPADRGTPRRCSGTTPRCRQPVTVRLDRICCSRLVVP